MPAQKRKATTQGSRPTKKRASMVPAGRTLRPSNTSSKLSAYNAMMRNPFKTNTPVQLHDNYRGETSGLILSQTIPMISSSTSTYSAVKFRPSVEGFYALNQATDTITATSFASGFTSHHEYQSGQNLLINAAKFKILCMGVEVSYVGPQDAMSGTIRHYYRQQTGNVPSDASTWDDIHSSSGIQPISRKKFTYVVRPVDIPRFQSLNANCEDYIGGLALAFDGVDFNNILVKTRIFLEAVPQSESTLADTATQSPHHPGIQVHVSGTSNSTF